jgi:4-amino-4-deoxy-L-arabinose transferase-like glycosyltransferase
MSRRLSFFILLAFLLRFGLGAFAYFYLPVLGHDSKPQQAGYLFLDAYNRDTQALDLAQSGRPLLEAFSGKYESDQYGGLLWLSAFIYRYLSGGVHQPLVIIFLAALAGSLGGIFVYLAAKRTLDDKTALLAALLFLFFPEAILMGAAQMREPFLITFIAMAFYGLVEWQDARNKRSWLWIVLALAGMLFLSAGFALVTIIGLAGWVYFSGQGRRLPWQVVAIAVGVFVLALIVLAASWDSLVAARGSGVLGVFGDWARETAKWNAYVLKRSSGIVQLLFENLPGGLAMPFVTVYGILQPVLPAAIFEPGIPFWQALGIIRALGWYALLPFVAFSPFSAWTLSDGGQRRRQWGWISILLWAWIIIAAVRGGGDQWDNPRYRVILLTWMAMLAAQAFYALKSNARRWFWRIVAVELIILLVFTHWYSFRYLQIGFNLGIRNTIAIAIGLAALVVAGDWFWSRWKGAD